MPKITFIQPDGSSRIVEPEPGQSLMSAAVQAGVRGIDAECGGAMSCATCHVHLAPDWVTRLGPAQGDEYDLVSFTDSFDAGVSRLSCQIPLTDDCDGLVVTVP